MKTPMGKTATIKRSWHLINLSHQTLGRQATHIASLLMGKHKPDFTPHLDGGDYVVVINAAAVHLTGNKSTGKLYRHHTGHPGGFREYSLKQMMHSNPRQVVALAVKGMLPKNKLRAPRLKRLKIFTHDQHPYQARFNQ